MAIETKTAMKTMQKITKTLPITPPTIPAVTPAGDIWKTIELGITSVIALIRRLYRSNCDDGYELAMCVSMYCNLVI